MSLGDFMGVKEYKLRISCSLGDIEYPKGTSLTAIELKNCFKVFHHTGWYEIDKSYFLTHSPAKGDNPEKRLER